jgi:ABC-type branched-subunit amino acid transport system substrate-binding protein
MRTFALVSWGMSAAGLVLAAWVAVLLAAGGAAGAPGAGAASVAVPRGEPVRIVLTAATEFPDFSTAFENAARLAIEDHPAIRGFPVQLDVLQTSCFGDNAGTAAAIVADSRNAAVIGHFCSLGFASALPVYEAAGVVAISGSATGDDLSALGPTVFDRTIVRDGDGGEAWLQLVDALPSVAVWNARYEARFGSPPAPFAAMYFDAASLLLKHLQQTSRIVDGELVIDRAALAAAVRGTTRYQGVTCTVQLDPATGNRVNDPDALARCGGA